MPKTFIKMLESAPGHDQEEDGRSHPVKQFHKGETYEVHEVLAKAFVDQKLAEPTKAPKPESPKSEESDEDEKGKSKGKNRGSAPENK